MAILQAYEQVLEAYKQSFRNLQKGDDQTYVEFAKEKQQCFEKVCRSREVNGFDSLQNLILLKDFKDNIPHSVRVHLDDLDVVDMQTAARKADDYAVTHKLSTPTGKRLHMVEAIELSLAETLTHVQRQGLVKPALYLKVTLCLGRLAVITAPGQAYVCDYHRSPTHSNEQCYGQGRLPKDSHQTMSL